jgi:hypothetical protein
MSSLTASTGCAEKRLLCCCARTRLHPGVAEEIKLLVSQPLDWQFLLAEAAEHSITPLVEKNLSAAAADLVPAEHLAGLKAATRANTVRCLYLTAELNKLLADFASRGILAIPYKGPVVAQQVYGDIAIREFEDLDVILPQRDVPKAHEIMLAHGYKPKFPWILSSDAAASLVPGEYNYRDEARRLMVELHTEITLRHFPAVPDLDSFSQRLITISLAGRDSRTFAPEDALPILCIHGSKDFWERLSWIADISELIQAYPRLDWGAVERRARDLKSEYMLWLGLTLARDLLDAPLPREIEAHAKSSNGVATIAKEVEARTLSRTPAPLDALGRFRFRQKLVPSSWFGWRYALRLSVVPAEEDWMMLRLPPSLAPLYIALRPLRLLRKYGWAGRRSPKLSV